MTDRREYRKRFYTPGTLFEDLHGLVVRAPELSTARRGGRVSPAFAERIMLAVTAVNQCRYCSYGHTRMALQAGLTEEEIQLLLDGHVDFIDPDEAPALFFAQHVAESGGRPDRAAVERLVETYGPRKARDIQAYVRMITFGNLIGNTVDALLSRLGGVPASGSTLWRELLTLALLPLAMPFVAVGMGAAMVLSLLRGRGR